MDVSAFGVRNFLTGLVLSEDSLGIPTRIRYHRRSLSFCAAPQYLYCTGGRERRMDGEYSSWRPRTTPAEQPGGGLFGRLRANVQRGARVRLPA